MSVRLVQKAGPVIDIVLASYNGADFIQQQIESIQACAGYDELVARILVVDDGSSDATLTIVSSLAKSDGKISFFAGGDSPLGVVGNFSRGLKLTCAPYVMFCDQDDVWLPNKIKLSLHAVVGVESSVGRHIPVLTYSDLKVVDSRLQVLADSFWAYQGIPESWGERFSQLLVQNVAAGCTMLFNRALVEKACPFPGQIMMHDWWMLLVAHVFGKVVRQPQTLVLYRQHSSNQIGAKKLSGVLFFQFVPLLRQAWSNLYRLSDQARAFSACFKRELQGFQPESELKTLQFLVGLSSFSTVKKVGALVDGTIRKSNLFRNVCLFFLLLFPPYRKSD